jgi:hypothetical protein
MVRGNVISKVRSIDFTCRGVNNKFVQGTRNLYMEWKGVEMKRQLENSQ